MNNRLIAAVAALLVVGCVTSDTLAEAPQKAIDEVKAYAQANKVSEADALIITSALTELVAKGVPDGQVTSMMKAAIDKRNSGAEIRKIADSLKGAIEKEGSAKEIAAIARLCVEEGFTGKDIAGVMAKVEEAMENDASARQLRVLAKDLLKRDINAEKLSVAVEAAGELVAQGYSPEDARKSIGVAAIRGLKEGLKEEKFAAAIGKEVEKHKADMETMREKFKGEEYGAEFDGKNMPEDIKDRIKMPGGTEMPKLPSDYQQPSMPSYP